MQTIKDYADYQARRQFPQAVLTVPEANDPLTVTIRAAIDEQRELAREAA